MQKHYGLLHCWEYQNAKAKASSADRISGVWSQLWEGRERALCAPFLDLVLYGGLLLIQVLGHACLLHDALGGLSHGWRV